MTLIKFSILLLSFTGLLNIFIRPEKLSGLSLNIKALKRYNLKNFSFVISLDFIIVVLIWLSFCFHLIHFIGQCVDEVSRYRCECEVGFNGTLCEHNIDDCVLHTCNNYSLCQDGINNYTCVCKPGESVLFLLQS